MLEFGSRDRLNGEVDKIFPNSNREFNRRMAAGSSMAELVLEALEQESSIDHPVCFKSFK